MSDERQDALTWLGFALGDLGAARSQSGRRVRPRIVAFHAQQAAEKAIKAILTSTRTDFPKTHDLARLMDLLPANPPVPTSADDLEWLSYFGTAGRYVMDDVMAGSEPGWEDAAQAFRLAEEILDWARDAAERQG